MPTTMTDVSVDPHEIAPFSSGWSLGEEAYGLLRDDLRELGAETIIEFGAGTSTVHLSHDFPDAEIWSHEHHPQYAEETRQLVARAQGGARVHVATSPLSWQFYGGCFFLSYTRGPLPASADAMLVDGPPFWTRRGREACLYMSHMVLRVGGRVYLDDYRRPAEQRTAENWVEAFEGAFRIRGELATEHRMCVLEKVRESAAPRMSSRHVADATYMAMRYGVSKLRGVIPS